MRAPNFARVLPPMHLRVRWLFTRSFAGWAEAALEVPSHEAISPPPPPPPPTPSAAMFASRFTASSTNTRHMIPGTFYTYNSTTAVQGIANQQQRPYRAIGSDLALPRHNTAAVTDTIRARSSWFASRSTAVPWYELP